MEPQRTNSGKTFSNLRLFKSLEGQMEAVHDQDHPILTSFKNQRVERGLARRDLNHDAHSDLNSPSSVRITQYSLAPLMP